MKPTTYRSYSHQNVSNICSIMQDCLIILVCATNHGPCTILLNMHTIISLIKLYETESNLNGLILLKIQLKKNNVVQSID